VSQRVTSVVRRNIRKSLRRLRGDRLLADPKAHGCIHRNREHDVWRVVSKGAAVIKASPPTCRTPASAEGIGSAYNGGVNDWVIIGVGRHDAGSRAGENNL
jgi:hypothetical protein